MGLSLELPSSQDRIMKEVWGWSEHKLSSLLFFSLLVKVRACLVATDQLRGKRLLSNGDVSQVSVNSPLSDSHCGVFLRKDIPTVMHCVVHHLGPLQE